MTVDYASNSLRAVLYSVNGGPWVTLNVGGGSFNLPASTTVPVALQAGTNTIRFGNPTSYSPDLDRILISGDGSAVLPSATAYEAENATLGGSASPSYCKFCSGASKAGNLGNGSGTVTFTNIAVPAEGTYQLEIAYMTSGPRSFFMSVNGEGATELPLQGSTFDHSATTVMPVKLHAGKNTIELGNPSQYAPDLDRLVIAPLISCPN
jgi:hypothetical protein